MTDNMPSSKGHLDEAYNTPDLEDVPPDGPGPGGPINVRQLSQEELGTLLARLGEEGFLHPTMYQRIEEMAARIRDRVGLPDKIVAAVGMEGGQVILWDLTVGDQYGPGGSIEMTCKHNPDSDQYHTKTTVHRMGAPLYANSGTMAYPNPEDFEDYAVRTCQDLGLVNVQNPIPPNAPQPVPRTAPLDGNPVGGDPVVGG